MTKGWRRLVAVVLLAAPVITIGQVIINGAGGGTGAVFGSLSGGTNNRVLFTGATGLLTDDADLTFLTDTLSATKIVSSTTSGTAGTFTNGVNTAALTLKGVAATADCQNNCNSSSFNAAVTGIDLSASTPNESVGVYGSARGLATNSAGGYFSFDQTNFVSALASTGAYALIANNVATTNGILALLDGGILFYSVQDGGSHWSKSGAAKALTESTPTAFTRIAVAQADRQGGIIDYCVDANDATNYQTRCGYVSFALVNKAGAETCVIGTPADAIAETTGSSTLTVAFTGASNAAETCDILANAASSLTQTTLRINYTVRLTGFAGSAVTAQ